LSEISGSITMFDKYTVRYTTDSDRTGVQNISHKMKYKKTT